MAGWLETLQSMDEKQCKMTVNFLARRAFGQTAEILVSRNEHNDCYSVYLLYKGTMFFLIPYDSSGRIFSDGWRGRSIKMPIWKNVLKNMFEVVARSNGYVSYLSDKAHIVDSNISLEETLISAELSLNNN